MLKWDYWSVYWIVVWFGLGFGVPEGIALATGHSEHTLSYQVWHLEGLNSVNSATFWNPLTWSIPHYLVAALTIWLAGHFIYHIWH
jgi:hypothetical protein